MSQVLHLGVVLSILLVSEKLNKFEQSIAKPRAAAVRIKGVASRNLKDSQSYHVWLI